MITNQFKACLYSIFLLLTFSLNAEDLSLSLGTTTGQPGNTITIKLNLTHTVQPPTAVAFNLDINYDPNVLENPSIVLNTQLVTNKEIAQNKISDGKLRIICYGINQDIISQGAIADISFKVKTTAVIGTTQVSISDVVVANANASAIVSTKTDNSVTIQQNSLQPPQFVNITIVNN